MSSWLPGVYKAVRTLDLKGLRFTVASGIISARDGVNLSKVDFVTPGGIVGLACLLETWAADQERVRLLLPNPDVTGYLHRMNFFEHFKDRVVVDRNLGYLDARNRHPAHLSELQRVLEPKDVTSVIKDFRKILLSKGDLGEVGVRQCCTVLSEGLNNALEHASSPCGAYTAIQLWAKTGSVGVAVADAGVGIPGTIHHHPEAPTWGAPDQELIKLATTHQVSSKHEHLGRGGGFTSALRRVGEGSGRMKIWSARGWVELVGISDAGESHAVGQEPAEPFAGTCLEAVFPLS